jgi:hypothetical protein
LPAKLDLKLFVDDAKREIDRALGALALENCCDVRSRSQRFAQERRKSFGPRNGISPMPGRRVRTHRLLMPENDERRNFPCGSLVCPENEGRTRH